MMDRRNFLSGALAATAAAVTPTALKATPPPRKSTRELLNRALASPAGGLLMVRPLKDTDDDVVFAGGLTPATIEHCEVQYPSQVYIALNDTLVEHLREGALPSGIFDSAVILTGPLGKPFLCLMNAHVDSDIGWIIGYDLA